MKKLTFEFVQNYFTEQNCELLETEYINTRALMNYKCSCGNESKITFGSFQRGKRCRKCSGSEKLTLEYVSNYFQEHGCELLETRYISTSALMNYKCSCGNKSKIKFTDFQHGHRCIRCSGREKLTFEYVQNYFTEHGCELMETEYVNCKTPMNYKCECGNESVIRFANFQRGSRCMKCYKLKN